MFPSSSAHRNRSLQHRRILQDLLVVQAPPEHLQLCCTPMCNLPPSACSLRSAACWRKLSFSELLPQPSSVPPLPLCELSPPARGGSGSGAETLWAHMHSSCSCVPHRWVCVGWWWWWWAVCCGSPQPQGCSQPCGPGAPSPSRCGCAAALPSLPSAAPAEGEDRGWDVPRDKGNILGPLIP